MEGPAPVAHGRAFDVLFDWLCPPPAPRGTAKHYLYKLNPGGGAVPERKRGPALADLQTLKHAFDCVARRNTGLAAREVDYRGLEF